jgi:hypothetical protein
VEFYYLKDKFQRQRETEEDMKFSLVEMGKKAIEFAHCREEREN